MQVVYSLEMGGSEKLALEIASHLDPGRFRTLICGMDKGGAFEGELQRLNIPYHVFERKGLEPAVMMRIYRVIKANRVQIVHTHHFGQLFYSLLPAKWAGARLIHTEHEYYTFLHHPFSRFMIKPLARQCDRFTVVAPEVADYFREIGIPGDRILTIQNGVDLGRFDVASGACRKELDLQNAEIVFGSVARLEPEKDHLTLLRAFAQTLKVVPSAYLLLVGDGSLRTALERSARELGIADRVVFTGRRPDIPELLSAIDIFVLSSVREGLPIALIEAMAARKAIIATEVGSVGHLIKPGENGLLIAPEDPAALGEAMRRLAQDMPLRTRLAQRAYALAANSFSISRMMQQYESLYGSMVGADHVRN